MLTDSTSLESVSGDYWDYSHNDGLIQTASSLAILHMWKRAPGFFDVVAWSGNGTNFHPHNL